MSIMNTIEIYTDGSCINNGQPGSYGAYGFIILKDGKCLHEDSQFFTGITNNQMEILAPTKALEYLADSSIRGNIIVYSDSQYMINGILTWMDTWKRKNWITSGQKTPVKNKEYWIDLDNACNRFSKKPFFKWVKGHADNEMNCYIDELCTTTIHKNMSYAQL